MEIYTKYGEAVKFVTEGCLYVAGARGYSPWAGRLEHAYTLRDLHAAETARALAFQSVLLLGDASSIRAARAYTASVWEALKYARGEIAGEDGWRRCLDQISATRDDYFAAVRTELQIPPAGATPRVRDQLWPRLANPGAASPDES